MDMESLFFHLLQSMQLDPTSYFCHWIGYPGVIWQQVMVGRYMHSEYKVHVKYSPVFGI